jgi:hypothetical protein
VLLKKAKTIPAILMMRLKHPVIMKKDFPAKESIETEYKCSVYFYYNALRKNQGYAVEIETTRLF